MIDDRAPSVTECLLHPSFSSLFADRDDAEDDESAVVTEVQHKDVVAIITARAAVGAQGSWSPGCTLTHYLPPTLRFCILSFWPSGRQQLWH